MMSRWKDSSVRGVFQRAAAPEGGTRNWVRGCALALAAIPCSIDAQVLPSGQDATLFEVLADKVGGEDWLRFRFLAPAIARELGQLSFADVEEDMLVLCEGLALGYLKSEALVADKIAIGLSDRKIAFGASDPDATQFIEVYSVENDRCIWEAF